jgi:hypothetical protein
MGQQTSFPIAPTDAFEGTKVDLYPSSVSSFRNAEASAELPFGLMVRYGSTNQDALQLTATSNDFAGILVHSHAYAKPQELGDEGLKPNVAIDVLTHGRVWVRVEDDVLMGDPVRVRCVAAGAEKAGAFRTDADGTDCVDISAFARWVSPASAGGLAQLEINMTGVAGGVAD